ncbi:hypothetical protein B0H14DRAFT_2604051 [Mycena olivaceomarginata]|nr:hypothetical protein B0H14DRAFT_2604051 [Mycena olivaceomarginata]
MNLRLSSHDATEATGRTDDVPVDVCVVRRGESTRPEDDVWNRGMPPAAVVILDFRGVELLSPAKKWSVKQRGSSKFTHRGSECQQVASRDAGKKLGVDRKKQKFGIRSVFGDPQPTTEYLTCKRDWRFSFNLRHTRTTLTPHWRDSSTLGDESESGRVSTRFSTYIKPEPAQNAESEIASQFASGLRRVDLRYRDAKFRSFLLQ